MPSLADPDHCLVRLLPKASDRTADHLCTKMRFLRAIEKDIVTVR
jgi:hypothetical protein